MFQSRRTDQNVRVFNRMAVDSSMRPKVGCSIKYWFREWKDQGVLAKSLKAMQLGRCVRYLVPSKQLEAGDGGKAELLILLKISRGMLSHRGIPLLQHLGNDVGVEKGGVHKATNRHV